MTKQEAKKQSERCCSTVSGKHMWLVKHYFDTRKNHYYLGCGACQIVDDTTSHVEISPAIMKLFKGKKK